MRDFLTGVGVFSEVVSDGFWGNLDWGEFFAVVDLDCEAEHLWKDDHVARVGLDERLFSFGYLVANSAYFFEQGSLCWGEAAFEASSLPCG